MKKSRKVQGIGINDSDEPVYANGIPEPAYVVWKTMLRNTKRDGHINKVDPNWIYYTNFRNWYLGQERDGRIFIGNILDPTATMYGPDNSAFATQSCNYVRQLKNRLYSFFPTGVSYKDLSFIPNTRLHTDARANYKTPEQSSLAFRADAIARLKKIISTEDNTPVVVVGLLLYIDRLRTVPYDRQSIDIELPIIKRERLIQVIGKYVRNRKCHDSHIDGLRNMLTDFNKFPDHVIYNFYRVDDNIVRIELVKEWP